MCNFNCCHILLQKDIFNSNDKMLLDLPHKTKYKSEVLPPTQNTRHEMSEPTN
jgi:hypothetical protein